jgi:AraC family transcriptional activator of pobA
LAKVNAITCPHGILITDLLTIITDQGKHINQDMSKVVILKAIKLRNMENIIRLETISDYNAYYNAETLHPLVSVIDMAKAKPKKAASLYFGFYTIFLKEVNCGDLRYGKHTYDYQEGTLVFIAPGQVVTVENTNETFQPKGYALIFHPDLIHGTSLGKHIHNYSFFSYQSNEALHLSEREKKIVLDCFSKIEYELERAIDKHSKNLIVSNIELFLNYCIRFYDRQFITRDNVHKGILEKFEDLLNGFFQSGKPRTLGLPSVAYCAGELNLSPNYFGDLVKKETGKSAQEYIQGKLIDVAKEKIFDPGKSVSEVAYELGFKYPQHFTRFFKQHVGNTPNEYRSAVN